MPDLTIITKQPTILCIAGLDPSGGAGLAADIRACNAFGALALPVATAIVAQNTRGVKKCVPIDAETLRVQIETVLEDIRPGAIKLGMLPGKEAIETVISLLRPLHGIVPIIIDTVFAPSSGPKFNDDSTIELISQELLPLADLITPNALEARQLGASEITDLESMKGAAHYLKEHSKAQSVLLKGGHVADPQFAIDVYFDGKDFLELRAAREGDYEVRGTGCLLASAIAAQIAGGKTMHEAVRNAKPWLTEQYRAAKIVGGGRRITAVG